MEHRIQSIASIIFALVFIAILVQMNGLAVRFGTNVNSKVNNATSVSENYELQTFNNTEVTGDTVISAINNCDSMFKNKLSILVITQDNPTGVTYGNTEGCDFSSYDALTAAYPISPTQRFTATLEKNTNDVVTQIRFQQVP